MFCNQCGKENRDGTKFCVQCGAKLKTAPAPAPQPAGGGFRPETPSYGGAYGAAPKPTKTPKPSKSFNEGDGSIKNLVLGGAAALLCLIAAFNIVRVYINPVKIMPFNEEQAANGGLLETKTYFYIPAADGLKRVNKNKKDVEKISNKDLSGMFASKNGTYWSSESGSSYKAMDRDKEVKDTNMFPTYVYDKFCIYGKYNYKIANESRIVKRLNSEKYGSYDAVAFDNKKDYKLYSIRMYKGNLYAKAKEHDVSSNYCLLKINPSSGKEKVLLNEVVSYDFTGNHIVYSTSDSALNAMDLNGGGKHEITGVSLGRYSGYSVGDDSIYYTKSDNGETKMYKYDLKDNKESEINKLDTAMPSPSYDGFVLYSYGKLVMFDKKANITGEVNLGLEQ